MARLPRVMVIGGGFGGIALVKKLRKTPCEIILIDKQNHHLFQPLLYQVATAGLSPANIAYPIRSIFRDDPRVTVLMAEVLDIDTEERVVRHSEGESHYDYLVIAAGAKNGWFGRPEWSATAVGMKSIADAIEIRSQLLTCFEQAEMARSDQDRNRLMTFIVIGGGPTGVEMAGAIAELGKRVLARDFRAINPANARVILIELGEKLLPSFDPKLSDYAKSHLEKIGVEVWLATRVTDIREGMIQSSRGEIPAGVVVWAAGVEANPASRWLKVDADRGGRISVDDHCRVNGIENVFAIGDLARFEEDDLVLPGVAPVAMQQGAYVADVIERDLRGWPKADAFRYKDPGSMATIGRSAAVVEFGNTRMTGFIAWLAWLFVHLIKLLTFRNRALVLMQWIFAYFSWKRGARLITRMRRE